MGIDEKKLLDLIRRMIRKEVTRQLQGKEQPLYKNYNNPMSKIAGLEE